MIYFKSERQHLKDVSKLQKLFKKNEGSISLKRFEPSNTLHHQHQKQTQKKIDLSSLNRIVALDPIKQWVTVEPRMRFSELCNKLFRYGFIPQVVPEFRTITVGGAILGSSLESSSFKYGQFGDTCLECEAILGNGELVHLSSEHNRELFYALQGSFGSFCLLTLAKIRIIRAKKNVELSLHSFETSQGLFDFFQKKGNADFLEGIALSNSQFIGIEAHMIEKETKLQQTIGLSKWWSPWYLQTLIQMQQEGKTTIILSLMDYLFRLDRSAFWMGRYLLKPSLLLQGLLRYRMEALPTAIRSFASTLTFKKQPSFWYRLLFGWAFSSQFLYRLWHHLPSYATEELFFVQDFYAPISEAKNLLENFSNKLQLFPIWLCPIKGTSTPQFLSPHFGKSFFINLGFYGIPLCLSPVKELTHLLEKQIVEEGGRKMLYAKTYYSKQFFEKIYDAERQEALRKKYHAEKTFLPLYKKILSMI